MFTRVFYPEEAKWKPEIKSVKNYSFYRALDDKNVITLQHRVGIYQNFQQYGRDVVVKISINNINFYFDKAKYSKAELMGVKNNYGAFIIEKLFEIPELPS